MFPAEQMLISHRICFSCMQGTKNCNSTQRSVVSYKAEPLCPGLCSNCAAFLRIRPTEDASTDMDPLDDMRVHPLAYALAGSLARKALRQSSASQDDDSMADEEADADDDQTMVDRALKDRSKIEAVSLAVSAQNIPCIRVGACMCMHVNVYVVVPACLLLTNVPASALACLNGCLMNGCVNVCAGYEQAGHV